MGRTGTRPHEDLEPGIERKLLLSKDIFLSLSPPSLFTHISSRDSSARCRSAQGFYPLLAHLRHAME